MKFKRGDIVKISKTSSHYGQSYAHGRISQSDFDSHHCKYVYCVIFTDGYENAYFENELELIEKKNPITEKDLIL